MKIVELERTLLGDRR